MQNTTPMLKQYHAIKAQHNDCILFFRLGDFYEMFFEDAKVASRALDLVLTSRNKGSPHTVPMCGIPYHAAEGYIARLIKAGHKVAICEQVEDPSVAKGIVKRDVIRIITSGTYLDENSADTRYLFCLSPNGKKIGLAFTDPTTGTIQANEYDSPARTIELISRLPVCECVYPESLEEKIQDFFAHPLLKLKNIVLSPYGDWCFNEDIARKSLLEHFNIHNLSGFGIDELPQAVTSSGALLEYLKQMNKQPLRHIDKISLYSDDDYAFISPAAVHGLELDGVLKSINYTITALGKRMLKYWIYHPLKNANAIIARQQAVKELIENAIIQDNIKELFAKIPDIEKCLSKLSCGYTHPRDLLAIRNSLSLIPDITRGLYPLSDHDPFFKIADIPDLRELLENAISPDIPLANADGKVIKKGYHAEIDSLREIQENGRQWLKDFQVREIERTGINSLKVGYNKVFGYYIEITKAHMNSAPEDYIRKQTLVNAERFITQELKEYEEKILTAQDKIFALEKSLIQKIQKEILDHSAAVHTFCQSIATIDTLYSLSILAKRAKYIFPVINEETVLDIRDGRHPIVEKTSRDPFVANDTLLDCEGNHLIILTGPNMAGKSTYIRQSALLVILAQIGSPIPASAATIGCVDKIFTRIGAHDDIAKGQSTFMVEMNETADILNNATDRSLIILDEIGRGTSTFDGLSLAWALAEHLQTTKSRTLFATHFHELTALAGLYEGVKNYNVSVKEWKDEIIFLHKIILGSSDDSYGIYVAKLAGIPTSIIKRARQILGRLEKQSDLKETMTGDKPVDDQLTLFSPQPDPLVEEVRATIEAMDINTLTPLDALNTLKSLKDTLEKEC